MPITAELRNIVYLTGKRRCGTDIHRRHLLGHGPSWSQPYSGVSDVPRHRPVSDVPKQDIALSATVHAQITRYGATVNQSANPDGSCRPSAPCSNRPQPSTDLPPSVHTARPTWSMTPKPARPTMAGSVMS